MTKFIKKWFLKLYFGNRKIILYNRFHSRRKDIAYLRDFLAANHFQQAVFPITLPDGTKSYGQIGHYFDLTYDR